MAVLVDKLGDVGMAVEQVTGVAQLGRGQPLDLSLAQPVDHGAQAVAFILGDLCASTQTLCLAAQLADKLHVNLGVVGEPVGLVVLAAAVALSGLWAMLRHLRRAGCRRGVCGAVGLPAGGVGVDGVAHGFTSRVGS